MRKSLKTTEVWLKRDSLVGKFHSSVEVGKLWGSIVFSLKVVALFSALAKVHLNYFRTLLGVPETQFPTWTRRCVGCWIKIKQNFIHLYIFHKFCVRSQNFYGSFPINILLIFISNQTSYYITYRHLNLPPGIALQKLLSSSLYPITLQRQ